MQASAAQNPARQIAQRWRPCGDKRRNRASAVSISFCNGVARIAAGSNSSRAAATGEGSVALGAAESAVAGRGT